MRNPDQTRRLHQALRIVPTGMDGVDSGTERTERLMSYQFMEWDGNNWWPISDKMEHAETVVQEFMRITHRDPTHWIKLVEHESIPVAGGETVGLPPRKCDWQQQYEWLLVANEYAVSAVNEWQHKYAVLKIQSDAANDTLRLANEMYKEQIVKMQARLDLVHVQVTRLKQEIASGSSNHDIYAHLEQVIGE